MPTENKGTPQPLTLGSENNGVKKDFRQCCKYGKDCYQKNPMHHQKFRHPKDDEDVAQPENKEGKEFHSYYAKTPPFFLKHASQSKCLHFFSLILKCVRSCHFN